MNFVADRGTLRQLSDPDQVIQLPDGQATCGCKAWHHPLNLWVQAGRLWAIGPHHVSSTEDGKHWEPLVFR